MERNKEQIHSSSSSSSWLSYWRKFTKTSKEEFSAEGEAHENEGKQGRMVCTKQNKPGGWKSMPFILGNETFERLATFGVLANFMVYLKREYHMDQVAATNLINIFSGVSNFGPLLGAFLSDAFIGRFWAILIGSFASFLGMVALTLTAWIPSLTPPWCPYNDQKSQTLGGPQLGSCAKPTGPQLGFLVLSLGLLSIGTAGIRPCSMPFGIDQFDHTTEEGRRGINSYYNCIFRVFVAAFKKRHLELPRGIVEKGVFHDPPPTGLESLLPLTHQYSFLNKAALIQEGELSTNGTPTPKSRWTLCSIQEVEQVKCVIRVLPIWASGIICFTSAAQQSTFAVSQAMIMNRSIGPKFQIPPGSIGIISMLTVGVCVPIYDRLIVPALRKVTKHENGLTLLQRMGIGIVFSVLSMVVAGLAEQKRRNAANVHHQMLSIMWLAPQLVMLGLAEGFNFIAQIEFYNNQFPENLRSMATSMFFCTIAGANYLSSVVVSLVHKYTGGHGKPNWLTNDINQGRVDYFYYLLAIMGVVNYIYFLVCAKYYKYKGISDVNVDAKAVIADIEFDAVKH